MRAERARVEAAEAHVEPVLLAEAPAVTLEVGGEVQLRSVAADGQRAFLLGGDPELDLLGDHDRIVLAAGAQVARHRAEMAARADEEGRAHLPIDHPRPRPALERR